MFEIHAFHFHTESPKILSKSKIENTNYLEQMSWLMLMDKLKIANLLAFDQSSLGLLMDSFH